MASFEYHVVPFVGQLKSGEDVSTVSQQLTDLINHYAALDWEFYSLDNVDIQVKPGCLASLLGATAGYTTFNQVILRKERVG